MNGIPSSSTSVQQECAMKVEPPHKTAINKIETFAEKVKKRIMESQANEEKLLKKLESEPINTILVNDIKKQNTLGICKTVLQNELPLKEKDLRSFVIPCIIGNTTVSNALADLGASISVMPFSMFKHLGLGNPRSVNVNRRVWGKISPEVGKEQSIFNANKGATPVTVSPLCVIKDFDVIDNFGAPKDLEELLMDDHINEDLGNFLLDNDLLPDYEDPGAILLSLNKSLGKKRDPVGEFQDSNDNLGVGIYDFVAFDDLWDNLDP
ncbi:reverse transcriptase domain-containing protein [Tanacetum coccineum]